MADTTPATANVPPAGPNPTAGHVIPFFAWIFLLHMLGDAAGWKYALISVTGAGLFLYYRPWRFYPRFQVRNLPLALFVGLVVFVVWVGLETAWARAHLPALQQLYETWCVLPFGKLREPLTRTPYAPEVCGLPLTLVKLAGSAFVIAVIEEFFWRGFAYRWAQGGNFLTVDPGKFSPFAFILMVVVFGSEHREWLAGLFAGAAYGWLYIRTRDIWAASVAHVLTNFVLGVYVILTGSWQFW